MQILENKKIREKAYIEDVKNGPKIIVIPKKGFSKKYAIVGVKFGSIDNCFINPKKNKKINIPDGVAHFLEHKMFEQSNGTNSLDVLSALGVNANAYTTDSHTAYLIECTDNFDLAYKELLNYVQNPYFTRENVNKEKGIICQEIRMYEDDPISKVYQNALLCLYKNNPVRIDTAGTEDSVNSINKRILYNCYDTFYNPSNLIISLCGDFNPEEIIKQTKEMLKIKDEQKEIERIYPKEPEEINKPIIIEKMPISIPIFVIGLKDNEINLENRKENIKKAVAIEILLNILIGSSSELYKELYNNGDILSELSFEYEWTETFAHALIAGQSQDPEKILNRLIRQIKTLKVKGIDTEEFDRVKKKIYGENLMKYDDVSNIARGFLLDSLKGICAFDEVEEFSKVDLEYTKEVLDKAFLEKNIAISIISPN